MFFLSNIFKYALLSSSYSACIYIQTDAFEIIQRLHNLWWLILIFLLKFLPQKLKLCKPDALIFYSFLLIISILLSLLSSLFKKDMLTHPILNPSFLMLKNEYVPGLHQKVVGSCEYAWQCVLNGITLIYMSIAKCSLMTETINE